MDGETGEVVNRDGLDVSRMGIIVHSAGDLDANGSNLRNEIDMLQGPTNSVSNSGQVLRMKIDVQGRVILIAGYSGEEAHPSFNNFLIGGVNGLYEPKRDSLMATATLETLPILYGHPLGCAGILKEDPLCYNGIVVDIEDILRIYGTVDNPDALLIRPSSD